MEGLFNGMDEEEAGQFIEKNLKLFWENGYIILPSAIESSIIQNALNKIMAGDPEVTADLESLLEFNKIFLKVNETFDDKRLQASLPKGFEELKKFARKLVKAFNMRWKPGQWVVLKSLPGGEEQDPHRDFCKFEIGEARKKYPKTIQAGLVIGLMAKTRLVVYTKCFAEADSRKRTEIEFGPGDCVIFRGDLVHSGAKFDVVNYRVHCMLQVKGSPMLEDITEFAPPPAFKCDHCAFMAPTTKKIRDHRKYCLNNPNHKTIVARYQHLNSQGRVCVLCNKFYAKRNTFYQHWRRRHKQSQVLL